MMIFLMIIVTTLFSLPTSLGDVTSQQAVIGYTYALLANSTYVDNPQDYCFYEYNRTFVTSDENHVVNVFQGDNQTVFAFRGLIGAEEVVLSLNADLVPLFNSSPKSQNNPQVHDGFRNWALDFEQFMLSFQNTTSGDIVIVGHSAGGAVSYILAAYMTGIYPWFKQRLRAVYTYGAPRAGDKSFANYWKDNLDLDQDYRYVMYRNFLIFGKTRDPVIEFPPGDYQQPNQELLVKCQNPDGDSCNLRDLHRMAFYLFSLAEISNSRCLTKPPF